MPASLPTIRSGAQAIYPVNRTVQTSTTVLEFLNGSEQRWTANATLARFVLSYRSINLTDRNALDAFIVSSKGSFDSTWQFTLGATTYGSLTFEDDEFTWQEEYGKPLLYNGTIRIRQTFPSGALAGAGSSSAYPTFANGVVSGLPYSRTQRFFTLKNDLESGGKYTWGYYGFGLTGYPSDNRKAWKLTYPAMTDDDLATLEAHFMLEAGRLGTFTFTDPDNSVDYNYVRYGMDALEIRYQEMNSSFVQVSLVQFQP